MIHNKSIKPIVDFIVYNKSLVLIGLLYGIVTIYKPETGLYAGRVALSNMGQLLLVMPIILAMTSLTKAWIPEDVISNKLGNNSGLSGSAFALLLGSISAGPIYAAFPFAKTLLDKGASIRNITILLSSWAVIKVPMLATEMTFLGSKFMVTRWLLTTTFIIILSLITGKLVSRDDIIHLEDKNNNFVNSNKISVSSTCTGCQICLKTLPQEFQPLIYMEHGKAKMAGDIRVPDPLFRQLLLVCPRKAIQDKP